MRDEDDDATAATETEERTRTVDRPGGSDILQRPEMPRKEEDPTRLER